MFNTILTPPTVDQATVDHYVAKGRRLRANAWAEFFRALFPSTGTPTTTVKTAARIPA